MPREVLDLAGQICGLSVAELVGGRMRESVGLSFSVANPDFAKDLEDIAALWDDGVRLYKLKTGFASHAFDLERLETLRDNLRSLASLSADSGAKVILVPVAIPPNYGRRYTEAFSASFPKVAEETNSTLTPLIFDGVATNPELMQADGIHPTAEAQPLLLENIRPTLLAVLEQL